MKHVPLLIGCPVLGRSWIVDPWIEYTENACSNANVKPGYVFLGDARDASIEMLVNKLLDLGREVFFVNEDEPVLDYSRVWNSDRYKRMIEVRNRLLCKVRDISPSYFLSLDSDILLHPESLARLIKMSGFDAVGAKLYMEPPPGANSKLHNRNNPSYYILRNGRPKRFDSSNTIEVDVIMAAKLMGPKAYAVDYEFHYYGEDVGWSMACKRNGLRLGWDGAVTSKHVMDERYLDKVDPRCGY